MGVTNGCMLPVLISQDSAEGVWPVEGAAWPARGPHRRSVGRWPPRWGRSVSRGQAAAPAQGPAGGTHAHPGGTQQTAGVSAPSPPTATAPGDVAPPATCWPCFVPILMCHCEGEVACRVMFYHWTPFKTCSSLFTSISYRGRLYVSM